ncbi:MAG: dTDP-4-dehydrorhamnose reductase [Alphaproteobacteria bacterium]
MILLFGAGGQLGREVVRASAARTVPLVGLARAEADIADPAAVRDAIGRHAPSLVVNTAAYTKVDAAESETEAARHSNEVGPAVLAAASAAAGVPLVHISTDYVFDGSKDGAYVEDDQIGPISAYGRTKAAGERAVRETARKHVILRTSWVYGELGQNFLRTMLRLATTHDELRVVSDQQGCPTSTADLAAAILAIAPHLTANENVWGTYHYSGSGVTTWHGFASRIVAAQAPLTGRTPRVISIPTRDFPTPARRPANSVLDCGKFARVFGFGGRSWTDEADRVTRAVVRAEERHVA